MTVLVRAFPQLLEVVEQLSVVVGRTVCLLAEVVEMLQRTDSEVEVPVVVLKVYLVGA